MEILSPMTKMLGFTLNIYVRKMPPPAWHIGRTPFARRSHAKHF